MSVTSLVMSVTSHRGVDLYKILPNPDKFDESDPDLMLSTPSSEYYSITDANNLLADVDNDSIFLFHCNIRSLAKNFELLHDLLYCFDNIPDVIAVTETRINCNSSANIDLPNYKFTVLILKQWLVVLVFTSHPPQMQFIGQI